MPRRMSGGNFDMSHVASGGRNFLYGVAFAQSPDTDGDLKLWAKTPLSGPECHPPQPFPVLGCPSPGCPPRPADAACICTSH